MISKVTVFSATPYLHTEYCNFDARLQEHKTTEGKGEIILTAAIEGLFVSDGAG